MNKEHIAAQILLRAWPFPRGAGRIIDKFFAGLRFRDEVATVRTTDDFEIKINPNELIGKHIYLTGEFDRSIVDVLCKFAERGDCLLDIGANIGYVSSCFLRNVPYSTAVAVEPQEKVVKFLRINLDLSRSVVYPYALADTDGEAWFETNASNSGQGHIVSEKQSNSFRVATKSPDTMLREIGIKKIDLVKIDAEGFEQTIVECCLDHFDKLQPKAVLFEDSAYGAGAIAAMFSTIGYKTFGIRKSLTSLSLVDSSQRTVDYIAVSGRRSLPQAARQLLR